MLVEHFEEILFSVFQDICWRMHKNEGWLQESSVFLGNSWKQTSKSADVE